MICCAGPLVLKDYIQNDRGHALPAPKQKQQTPSALWLSES